MKEHKKIRYIGIDPGTNVLGYAIIEKKGKLITIIDVGVLNMKSLPDHQQKLKTIFQGIQSLINMHHPKEMAIEAPFFGKNVQSMLKLGRAQGVAMAAGITNNVPVVEYSPRKIKQAVTGNGNASKEQVAAMLETILKIKVNDLPLDATDALATAICHCYRAASALDGKKKYNNWSSFLADNPKKAK